MAKWFGMFGGSADDAVETINDSPVAEIELDGQIASLVNEASNDEIRGLAGILGFSDKDLSIPELRQELGKTIKHGGMAGDNDDKFIDFWDKAGFTATSSRSNQSRLDRYKRYQFMISQSSEINIAVW